jgi:hypothetical protein
MAYNLNKIAYLRTHREWFEQCTLTLRSYLHDDFDWGVFAFVPKPISYSHTNKLRIGENQ